MKHTAEAAYTAWVANILGTILGTGFAHLPLVHASNALGTLLMFQRLVVLSLQVIQHRLQIHFHVIIACKNALPDAATTPVANDIENHASL